MPSLKIGIDYTAALKQGGGIGRYTRGLVTALAQLDRQNRYTLLYSPDAPANGLQVFNATNFSWRRYPLSERLMTIGWHRFDLPVPVEWFSGPLDLFHSPNFILPPTRRAHTLLTVHDLSFVRHPHGAVESLRRWLMRVVPRSLDQADYVLADSHSTKQDLLDFYNVEPARISVVGAGVEPRFRPSDDATELQTIRTKYRLPEKFILSLGTLEPRKNFDGLIQAYSNSPVRESHHLVIAGGRGWLYEPIFAAAETSSVADRIHLIGFVADDDLPALYNLADVFAYPSHYEGFGIPVIEAMACGTPVVCADNSSLPEVAGEAALLIPATNLPALGEALQRLVDDQALRQRCREGGLRQAQKFTWSAAAQRLLEVYRRFEAK